MELSEIKSPVSLKAYSRNKGSHFFDSYSVHFYQESKKYLIKYAGNKVYFICTYWNPRVRQRGPVFSLLSMGKDGEVTIEQNSKNKEEIKKQYDEEIDIINDAI